MLALPPFELMVGGITVGEHYEQQIGGQLKSAREAAGLEVDDVVFKTQIPRSAVEALEAEDFSVFTSPVYAKSFLRQYSDFLHVDADPWLNALEPGAFVPGGSLRSLLDGPELPAGAEGPSPDHRGGLLSVLGLLALSAALVVGAIKGYEFFDRQFGSEDVRSTPITTDAFPPALPAMPVESQINEAPRVEPSAEAEIEPDIEVADEGLPEIPLKAVPVE